MLWRWLLATILATASCAAIDASAQPAARVYRIGTLDASSPDAQRLEGGRDSASNSASSVTPLAEELVRLKLDIIATAGGFQATQAARQATATIPIVMTTSADPVGLGLATSLARPGGNVTGMTTITSELSGKRFRLLRELIPKLSRLAVLWHKNPASALAIPDFEAVARAARVTLQTLGVQHPEELAGVFASMTRERAEALIVAVSAQFFPERKRLADLAIQHRLPTMHAQAEYVEAGGLVSYAPKYSELFRQAAVYVDKILKGAKPGELPIEQPNKLELVINMKTARTLGVTIPQAILLRAAPGD